MTIHHTSSSAAEFDCVIVGGGIHGTYCCQRLLEDTGLTRSAVAIVDPNERLLDGFRRKARACGMESLRSTFVHHIGTDPFGLESFAEARDREDGLRPTVDYPDRPSLDLFLDHAEHVLNTKNVGDLHIQTRVDDISERAGGGFRLTTTTGTLDTRTCVLAVGHGGRYRFPEWATSVDGVDHVWDGFDPAAESTETIIIGGGVTAAQLACELTETESVTMLMRHPLQWEVLEADPPWLNWHHIERKLHCYRPGSTQRLETVQKARYSSTIPPHLYETFESRLDDGSLRIVQAAVDTAATVGGRVQLTCEDGLRLTADRVVCATGFEPVSRHPFVDRLASGLGLVRGAHGLPVLDDTTLAWQPIDGRTNPLYVTGALALGTVGPYAPNLPGARRAADRITEAVDERFTTPSPTMTSAD